MFEHTVKYSGHVLEGMSVDKWLKEKDSVEEEGGKKDGTLKCNFI